MNRCDPNTCPTAKGGKALYSLADALNSGNTDAGEAFYYCPIGNALHHSTKSYGNGRNGFTARNGIRFADNRSANTTPDADASKLRNLRTYLRSQGLAD